MNKTLAGLVAAAGMLGCARDVHVYSPRPMVVEEVPGVGAVYTAVWSDAEQLKLSVYTELVDGTRPLDMSWSSYAPKDSLECLRERILLDARVDAPEYGLAGRVNMDASDDLCNRSVDSCRATYTPDNGPVEDVTADMCANADEEFASIKHLLDMQFFNIHTELTAWYERKRL